MTDSPGTAAWRWYKNLMRLCNHVSHGLSPEQSRARLAEDEGLTFEDEEFRLLYRAAETYVELIGHVPEYEEPYDTEGEFEAK